MPAPANAPAVPRLTYLRIKNYRALRDVEFRDLTPLSVFIGPNGSGKSTVLKALAFLAEAVSGNLEKAWESEDRFKGMLTRGINDDIVFELEFQELLTKKTIFYSLIVRELNGKIFVVKEILAERDKLGRLDLTFIYELINLQTQTSNFKVTSRESVKKTTTKNPFGVGIGTHISGSSHGKSESQIDFLSSIESPLKNQAAAFIAFIISYRYVHLTDDHLKGYSDKGPRERLSANGDNLPNVLYYLHLKHPEVLAKITAQMRRWVPALADIVPEITSDERLLLRFKDTPFEKPLPAQYMSDGTMRLAALLTLLYEPDATGLLGIEEPENELHPQLLTRLAEELIKATETRQLLVATHSPALLNALEPEQVWILHRGPDGYTQATRTADIPHVKEMVEDGSPLGYLWTSNSFIVGNPLAAAPDAR
ncbi:AAA family ATPase [Hymenobacter nivis]|nr:AAA family ATPase [Hymenobacter nivis]